MVSKKHSHITSQKLKLRCGEISNSRHKILTCLLSVTARGLAIDHRFLNPFCMCLVDKWLQTHPESTGKYSYSCGILALVPREPIYVKYLRPANHFGIPRNCSGENSTTIPVNASSDVRSVTPAIPLNVSRACCTSDFTTAVA